MPKGPDAEGASDLAAREIAAAGGTTATGALAANDTRFFGHPLGLSNLFFTELFERASYYGMRALLILYMTAETVDGGLGYDVGQSALVYGLYTSLVYLANLPGGWIADRLMGQRRSVLLGGILIAAGHFTMAFDLIAAFYGGLGLIILGTGMLKPNISVMVGQLYSADDPRRDAGFTIFYMGINIGAFAMPLICGALAVAYGWHAGFAAAGVGMALGIVVYMLTGKQLGDVGTLTPEAAAERPASMSMFIKGLVGALVFVGGLAGLMAAGVIPATAEVIQGIYVVVLFVITFGLFGWLLTRPYWTEGEKKRLYMIILLFAGYAVFLAAFEQAGSSLNLFAEQSTDRSVPGWLSWVPGLGSGEVPAAWFQSLNAFFIFTIAPFVAMIWVWLGRRKKDPSTASKFGMGLILLGLGFVVMVGAGAASAGGVEVSPWWLIVTYLLHTLGELTLSPVGLSAMTKLAPERVSSLMMGVWFLGASVGNFIAGSIAAFYDTLDLPAFMGLVAAIAIIAGIGFFFLAGPMKRMIDRADHTA
ncbi:peptide MFS transporter [Rubrivirga sp. IMCC45206]|uniref:peptide MFS transporter n=1 Tax=Rubrivirga sp. IMCC45206 TaxID=3391614 RepID=UPI0039902367